MNFNVPVLKAGIRRRLNKAHTLVETLTVESSPSHRANHDSRP